MSYLQNRGVVLRARAGAQELIVWVKHKNMWQDILVNCHALHQLNWLS